MGQRCTGVRSQPLVRDTWGGAPDALGPFSCRPLPPHRAPLTLSVKMTPNFQIWYLISMDMSL